MRSYLDETKVPAAAPHYVDQLLDVFAAEPERVVLRWDQQQRTGAQLATAIRSAAAVLREHGVGRASTVGVLAGPTDPATLLARYAANLLGAGLVHVTSMDATATDDLPVREQTRIVRDTGIEVLVADPGNLDAARAVRQGLTEPPVLAGFGPLASDVVDLTAGREHEQPGIDGPIGTVTYTSGTTGRPKGVCRGLNPFNAVTTAGRQVAERDTLLVTTPLSHSVGWLVDDALAGGGQAVLLGALGVADLLGAVEQHAATRLFIGTAQLCTLFDHPRMETTDLSSLREIWYAGSPAAPQRLAEAAKVLGPVLRQIYGSTEGWIISSLAPSSHEHAELLSTVGLPCGFAEITIRDPETGAVLPTGGHGEVCVRSVMVMDGYWDNPERTRAAFWDEWLRTGDIGFLDDGGHLHLVDRLSSMIKAGGLKVYPADVEKALLDHAEVRHAVVFGVRDSNGRERVHAVVEPRSAGAASAEDLRTKVAAELTPAHAPSTVEFIEAMPFTAIGKLDRNLLQSNANAASG